MRWIYTVGMEATVSGVPVHYAEYGSGTPVLALHGAGVDHREIAGALEPIFRNVPGFRRLYPDLPGMGRTPAPATIASNDDVLALLLGLIDSTIGDKPFLVMGHSYGGYLARAVANRRPEQAVGLALNLPGGRAHRRCARARGSCVVGRPRRRTGRGARGFLPQLLRGADA